MSNDTDSSDDDRLYHFRKMHRQQTSENDAKKIENRRGGSKVGKATNVNRFRAEYDKLSKDDYFGENPIYSPAHFRRRFWMHHSLFEKILEDLVEANPYFEQKKDALLGSGRFFATSKVNLSASNVGLPNFGRSAG